MMYFPKIAQQLSGIQINLTLKLKFVMYCVPPPFSTRHFHLLEGGRAWWLRGKALEPGCLGLSLVFTTY